MDGNNLALKIEGAQVITATSSDENYPASNIIDGEDKTFWMTSGMFPQAFVVSFPQPISVHRVTIHCKGGE